jgi:7-cyano-7-deazaguanine synthase in queuosine biosynthesis
MFSGGIDSTGMLYKLLTDQKYNEYDVHAHFILMVNKQNRYTCESKAVESLLLWFRNNCKKFEFTRNTMDFSFFMNKFPLDMDVMNFVCSQIIINTDFEYEYVCVGQTKTDLLQENMQHKIMHYQLIQKLLDTMLARYNKTVKKIYPLQDITKKQVWDMMPIELRKNTWSCRTPILKDNVYTVCGNCKACNEMKINEIGYYEK